VHVTWIAIGLFYTTVLCRCVLYFAQVYSSRVRYIPAHCGFLASR